MTETSERMLPPYIGRVALAVADLDRSIRFYEDIIGLRLLERDGADARMGAGDRTLLVLRGQPGARPVQRATGLYHFAILVPSRPDLGRTLRHLLEADAPISGYADHSVSEAIYLTDPDGHGIEIYRDRPRIEWEFPGGHLKMTTDPIDFRGVLAAGQTEPAQPWLGLADGTFIGHIHLQVAQIPDTEQFYAGLLGFDLMARYGPRASFLAANGYHHHLGANTWAGTGLAPAPEDAARLLWYEIRLADEATVAALADRLTDAGYPIERKSAQVWATDPSGIRVLLSADN